MLEYAPEYLGFEGDLCTVVGTDHPAEGYPWGSLCGYHVTNDWWILGPDGKQLLVLPPPWWSQTVQQMWEGQFLGLLHAGLPEPVGVIDDS